MPRRPERARRRHIRENRACADRAAECRRWRADWRPCGVSPLGASSASSGVRVAAVVEEFLAACSSSASLRVCCRCSGLVARIGERHLVRAEGAFDRQAVDHLRAGPAFGGVRGRSWASAGALELPSARASCWMCLICSIDGIERRGHRLVHCVGLVAFDEVGRPAIAARSCSSSSWVMRARIVGLEIL